MLGVVEDNHVVLHDTTLSQRDVHGTSEGLWTTIILQFLGGLSIPLRQLNNLRKTRIRWEIKFIFFFQSPVGS